MINRVKANNFRSYQELDVTLKNLNVLIGRNGSGKSNFLSMFQLLGDAAQGTLNTFVRREVGVFDDLRHYHAKESDIVSWEVEMESPHNGTLFYSVELGARAPAGYTVLSEKLERPPKEGHTRRYKFLETRNGQVTILKAYERGLENEENDNTAKFGNTPQELILPELKNETRYPAQVEAHHYLSDLQVFGGFGSEELNHIRGAQVLEPVIPLRLEPDGSNLISVMNELIQNAGYEPTLDRLYDVFETVFPDFKQFDLPSAGGGKATLAYRSKGVRKSISAHLMSDGQLRFLGLILLLLLPDPPKMILIDEPEIGMHPKMIEVFAGILKAASEKTQVIVATHSPQLLDHLPIESIRVVERKNGVSTITTPDYEALELWLEDYAPGYLWTNTTLLEG